MGEDEDIPDPYVCECGDVDPWCEYCGYHGHDCPLDAEEEDEQ